MSFLMFYLNFPQIIFAIFSNMDYFCIVKLKEKSTWQKNTV